MGTTKHTIDPANPPKTSKDDLARFDTIRDEDIDYSDIPDLDDVQFEKAKKVPVMVRYDADMLAWFKAQGPGYQTRMNAVLRAFFEKNRDGARG
ncbi:MAG: BrnA antitoxin family protein [Pseudomonadota bacterium]